MRAILQRVKEASVTVDGKLVSKIGNGFLILLGIEAEDNKEDIDWLSGKIARMRVFSDENDAMNLSLEDIGGEILVVSQFTLHASTKKGNRPSFIKAARHDIAIPLYQSFVNELSSQVSTKIQTGVFGAMMDIALVNDGPVTLFIDSKNKE